MGWQEGTTEIGGKGKKKKKESMHDCNLAAGQNSQVANCCCLCFRALCFTWLSASSPLAAFSGSP